MYSPAIIERNQAQLESELGLKLTRYEREESWNRAADLGETPRAVSKQEAGFIANELLLSKIDWPYWTRYCQIEFDGGGAGPMALRESQDMVLRRFLAPAEESVQAAVDRNEPTDGIRFYWHKARQLYATTTAMSLVWHRMLFHNDARAMCAVAEEPKITALYERHKRLYDGLTWWMRPALDYDNKADHIILAELKSSIYYFAGNQKGGMGQGNQYELQHLTECAFWMNPYVDIDLVLKDTLPQSPLTLAIRESTANGRGDWWHQQTEDARKGLINWRYIFIPWYAVGSKRRRTPPSEWAPDAMTIRHAEMVLSTSPELMGRSVQLDREQMYWWESERKEAQRNHVLNFFYMNCPATPEESFQHHQKATFEPEQIEVWRLGVSLPAGTEVLIRG